MDNYQIETAQNVNISQNVAPVSTRIGAFLLDILFITAYYIIVIMAVKAIDTDFESDMTRYVMFTLLGLPVFFYHLLFETLMNGQSPGKYISKIRVVKIDGSKPSFGSYLLRWVLRIIDISIASGGVALLSILLNGKGQRLGDLAAGTTVISEAKYIRIENTLAVDIPDDYKPTFPQVTTMSDSDIQTIKELYYKAKRRGDHKIINKLHHKILALTGIQTDIKPIDFIAIVINDYNYYTQEMH